MSGLPVLNIVTDYGAVSGSDCTTAIQNALNAASAGRIVFVPDGDYYVSSPLSSSNTGVRLLGESWNAQLVRSTSFPSTETAPLITLSGNYSSAENITINGNGSNVTNNTHSSEFEFMGSYCVADFIQVIGTLVIGIVVSGSYCTIQRSTVTGLASAPATETGYGIWAINYNPGVRILDCNVTGTGIDGIGISGVGFIVRGNNISNCHSYAGDGGGQLVVYGSSGSGTTSDGVVEGNVIEQGFGALSCGMESTASDILFSGNVISNQKWIGFAFDSGGHIQLVGNTIKNCGQTTAGPAVNLPAGFSNFLISGNRLVDDQTTPTQKYGLEIAAGASNHFIVTNNDFTGNVTSGFLNGATGTNTVVASNLNAS